MSFSFLYGNKSDPVLNAALARFAAVRIFGRDNDWGPCGTLGVVKGGNVVAAVVFHNWHPEHGVIEISAASNDRMWLSRRVLSEIFSICFEQHRCQLVVARMDPEAAHTRRIFRAYGFRETILPRFRGRDKDEIMMMLGDEEWRASKWSKRHGQEVRSGSA